MLLFYGRWNQQSLFWPPCYISYCSESTAFPMSLKASHLVRNASAVASCAAAPSALRALPWAEQDTQVALRCSSRLHRSTRLSQCFLTETSSGVPVLLPDVFGFASTFIERQSANSLGMCGVLRKRDWISCLSGLHVDFSVLAASSVFHIKLVWFQFGRSGAGLSAGFTQYDYLLPSLQSSFLYLGQ